MPTTVFTIAPVQTPFNFFSERISERSLSHLVGTLSEKVGVCEGWDMAEPDWPFGYGTIGHDNLPRFFRPFAILKLGNASGTADLISAELHLYDDCIGVLFLRWKSAGPDAEFDPDHTRKTKHFYTKSVKPLLESLQSALSQSADFNGLQRRATEFTTYDPDRVIADAPVWVARTVIDVEATADRWDSWIEAASNGVQSFADIKAVIGSDNCLFKVPEGSFHAFESDFIRAMSLCQFYAVFLGQYQEIFREDLRELESASRADVDGQVLKRIEASLDHLEFVQLQYERAIYGQQGHRRTLTGLINNAWRTELQFANTLGWAKLLRGRVDRQFRDRQVKQGQVVRTVLALIGGLSIVDLAMVLVNESRSHEKDGVFGLLDVVRLFSADSALYLAVVALAGFAYLTVRYDR